MRTMKQRLAEDADFRQGYELVNQDKSPYYWSDEVPGRAYISPSDSDHGNWSQHFQCQGDSYLWTLNWQGILTPTNNRIYPKIGPSIRTRCVELGKLYASVERAFRSAFDEDRNIMAAGMAPANTNPDARASYAKAAVIGLHLLGMNDIEIGDAETQAVFAKGFSEHPHVLDRMGRTFGGDQITGNPFLNDIYRTVEREIGRNLPHVG